MIFWVLFIALQDNKTDVLFLFQFKIHGEWYTWIDYDRFQELVQNYDESGGSKTFTAADYMARTPCWAVFGSRERGFDPLDTRYQRKNKKDISGCWCCSDGVLKKVDFFSFHSVTWIQNICTVSLMFDCYKETRDFYSPFSFNFLWLLGL